MLSMRSTKVAKGRHELFHLGRGRAAIKAQGAPQRKARLGAGNAARNARDGDACQGEAAPVRARRVERMGAEGGRAGGEGAEEKQESSLARGARGSAAGVGGSVAGVRGSGAGARGSAAGVRGFWLPR